MVSGWPDLNRRPLDPQSSALTKLRHSPCHAFILVRPRKVKLPYPTADDGACSLQPFVQPSGSGTPEDERRDPVGRGLINGTANVLVHVSGDRDRGVPKPVGDDLRVHTRLEPRGCVAVAQPVHDDRWKS